MDGSGALLVAQQRIILQSYLKTNVQSDCLHEGLCMRVSMAGKGESGFTSRIKQRHHKTKISLHPCMQYMKLIRLLTYRTVLVYIWSSSDVFEVDNTRLKSDSADWHG